VGSRESKEPLIRPDRMPENTMIPSRDGGPHAAAGAMVAARVVVKRQPRPGVRKRRGREERGGSRDEGPREQGY
jgi:hypothetical protein